MSSEWNLLPEYLKKRKIEDAKHKQFWSRDKALHVVNAVRPGYSEYEIESKQFLVLDADI